jgi:hypothetical protein
MENKKCSKPPNRYYIYRGVCSGSNLSSSFLAVVAVATSTWEPLQKTPRTVAENNTGKLLQNTAPLQKKSFSGSSEHQCLFIYAGYCKKHQSPIN